MQDKQMRLKLFVKVQDMQMMLKLPMRTMRSQHFLLYQKYLMMNGRYDLVSLRKMRRRKPQDLWKKISSYRVEPQKEELKNHVQEMKIMNVTWDLEWRLTYNLSRREAHHLCHLEKTPLCLILFQVAPFRVLASSSASSWPLRRELLNDLPHQLRTHLERARERDSKRSLEEWQEARALFASFLSQEIDGVPEDEELGKKVLKWIHYELAPPDVQKNIMDARTKEWNKFLEFIAVVEIPKEDAEKLIAEGHQCIPSKWVDVDKN